MSFSDAMRRSSGSPENRQVREAWCSEWSGSRVVTPFGFKEQIGPVLGSLECGTLKLNRRGFPPGFLTATLHKLPENQKPHAPLSPRASVPVVRSRSGSPSKDEVS